MTPSAEERAAEIVNLWDGHMVKGVYHQKAKDEIAAALQSAYAQGRADEREACAKLVEEADVATRRFCGQVYEDGRATLFGAAYEIRRRASEGGKGDE